MTEQKFSQIDGLTGSLKDSWGKVKETTDIQNNDTEEMEIASRKSWITEAMIRKWSKEENRKPQRLKSIEGTIIN